FVHLLDSEGRLVAQHDAAPWWEAPIPTSTWRPGEQLLDRHPLNLPPDLPPGEYQLRVGVYYWETLERLPVLENGQPSGDSVELGRVTLP
ncbi:MAG: glycosyl transferase, partial [Chloroflexi bacterium]